MDSFLFVLTSSAAFFLYQKEVRPVKAAESTERGERASNEQGKTRYNSAQTEKRLSSQKAVSKRKSAASQLEELLCTRIFGEEAMEDASVWNRPRRRSTATLPEGVLESLWLEEQEGSGKNLPLFSYFHDAWERAQAFVSMMPTSSTDILEDSTIPLDGSSSKRASDPKELEQKVFGQRVTKQEQIS